MAETILITGANRGIGLAIAHALLKGGHTVLAGTRQPDESPELQTLAEQFPKTLHILALDVTSDASVGAAARQTRHSGLDLLINNAGVFPEEGDENFADLELDHFEEAFRINVVGVARMIQAFAPILEKSARPRIVNISSGAGSIADKSEHYYYAYSASKAALNMLTRTVAAEYRARGIAVVAMTPGWVRTRMGGEQAPLSPEESGGAIACSVLGLTLENTSTFVDRTGNPVEYGW